MYNILILNLFLGDHYVCCRDDALAEDLDDVLSDSSIEYVCLKCSGLPLMDLVSHFEAKIKALENLNIDKDVQRNNLIAEFKTIEQEMLKIRGARETHLDQLWEKVKLNKQKYFGGEGLTWNAIDLVYKDIDAGKFTFLEAIKDHPDIYMKHKRIYTILANVNKAISKKNATKSELEMGAKYCELFGEIYPVLFPEQTITRKQHVFCFVFPDYLRSGYMYKILKIEHAGENIHAKYNRLEKKHNNQKDRGKRFFFVIRDLFDESHVDRTKFKKINKFRRRLL